MPASKSKEDLFELFDKFNGDKAKVQAKVQSWWEGIHVLIILSLKSVMCVTYCDLGRHWRRCSSRWRRMAGNKENRQKEG